MSEPKITKKERFTYAFPDTNIAEWSDLAELVLVNKTEKLKNPIQTGLGIQFDAIQSQVIAPIRTIEFWGPPGSDEKLRLVLNTLYEMKEKSLHFSKPLVREVVRQVIENGFYDPEKTATNSFNSAAKFRTPAQEKFRTVINEKDISFGAGPAGTGKTHVAVQAAAEDYAAGRVKRIVITRAAVEAGEKLGALPGTQEDKLSPFLRPIFDILEKIYGDSYKKMLEQKQIEIAPVAFLRGRTFEDCFVVVDECQNMSYEQLKMAQTRLGPGSKMVLCGDPDQSDLPPGMSGMPLALRISEFNALSKRLGTFRFTNADVMRSDVVKELLEAEEAYFAANPQEKLNIGARRPATNANAPAPSARPLSDEDCVKIAKLVAEMQDQNRTAPYSAEGLVAAANLMQDNRPGVKHPKKAPQKPALLRKKG